MNEATLEFACAAVASPHWRWMSGMRESGGTLCAGDERDGEVWIESMCGGHVSVDGWVPDFDDPVTVEAVGILAREAWGADAIDVRIDVAPRMEGLVAWWTARTMRMHRLGHGTVRCVDVDVRVACYVDAILSAPAREVER